jgi:hypothetical protein
MLFAPKAGADLRNQIGEQAGNLANSASEGYRKATESAGQWAERGRDMYDKARDAVARGADEAQRYVRDTASGVTGSPSPSSASGPSGSSSTSSHSGSSYGGGSSSDVHRG